MDDPYSILGLYPDCSYEEAKGAYRKAALMHHPDRHPPARKAEAERRFRILAHAFQQVCKELGHPINSSGSKNSNSASVNTKNSPNSNSSLVKSGTISQPSNTLKSIEKQPSKIPKSIERQFEPSKALGSQPARSTKNSPVKTILSDEPRPTSHPQDPLDDLDELNNYSSRPISSLLDDEERDDYPRGLTRPPYPTDRRSSFSHPSERGSKNRAMVNDYDHSMGPKHHQQYKYPDQEQLYDLPRRNRDQDWNFGLTGDDFFSSGMDRFGATGAMMDGMGLGFDRMMSSAFQGLSMAGPDPDELSRMGEGNNCSMRMRQSKMVMGRTEDGSWAGKRMEKHTNMSNGRLEVSENAQDIKMGGGPSSSANRFPPPWNGDMRRGAEDWNPPTAYQGGGTHHYGEEEYVPSVGERSARRMQPGMTPTHGDVIPGHARHGSLSHSSRSNVPSMGGYYEQPSGLQRRPSSRFNYGPDPGYSNRPMGRDELPLGYQPMAHSLARRPSGEISARY